MTIMLKNGKEQLKTDIVNEINNIKYNTSTYLLKQKSGVRPDYDYTNMAEDIYLLTSRGNVVDLFKLFESYTDVLMSNTINALLNVVDRNIYTQEDMGKDLGLRK